MITTFAQIGELSVLAIFTPVIYKFTATKHQMNVFICVWHFCHGTWCCSNQTENKHLCISFKVRQILLLQKCAGVLHACASSFALLCVL